MNKLEIKYPRKLTVLATDEPGGDLVPLKEMYEKDVIMTSGIEAIMTQEEDGVEYTGIMISGGHTLYSRKPASEILCYLYNITMDTLLASV
jgi:hypothetical protein